MIDHNGWGDRGEQHRGQRDHYGAGGGDTNYFGSFHVTNHKPVVCDAHVMVKAYEEVKLTAAQRDNLIVKLRRHGYSYRQIGSVVGMTANGVMTSLNRIKEGRSGRAPRA